MGDNQIEHHLQGRLQALMQERDQQAKNLAQAESRLRKATAVIARSKTKTQVSKLVQENEQLKAELQNSFSELSKMNTVMRESILNAQRVSSENTSKAHAERDALQAKLNESEERCASLTKDVGRLRLAIDASKGEAGDDSTSGEGGAVRKAPVKLLADISQLEEEKMELETAAKKMESESEASKKALEASRAEVADLQARLAEAQTSIEKGSARIEFLSNEVKDQDAKIQSVLSNSREEKERAAAVTAEQERTSAQKHGELAAAAERAAGLMEEVQALTQANKGLTEELAHVRSSLDRAERNVAAARQEARKNGDALRVSKEDCKAIKENMKGARVKLREQIDASGKLQRRINELSAELQAAKVQSDGESGQLATLQAHVTLVTQRIEAAEAEAKKQTETADRLRQELSHKGRRIEDLVKDNMNRKRELGRAAAVAEEKDNTLTGLEEKVGGLESQLQAAQAKIDESLALVEEKQAAVVDLTAAAEASERLVNMSVQKEQEASEQVAAFQRAQKGMEEQLAKKEREILRLGQDVEAKASEVSVIELRLEDAKREIEDSVASAAAAEKRQDRMVRQIRTELQKCRAREAEVAKREEAAPKERATPQQGVSSWSESQDRPPGGDSAMEEDTDLRFTVQLLEAKAQQLSEENERKDAIIKNYMVREKTGLSTAEMDMDISRRSSQKGNSFMGGLFRGVIGDSSRTTADEVYKKMEVVFQETLLKNMQLKDDIKTIGTEVSRLIRENKELRNR